MARRPFVTAKWLAGLALALLASFTNAARGEAAERSAECAGLCWSAPPECPREAAVQARVLKLAARASLPSSRIRGEVSRVHEQWRLTLTQDGERRVIDAPDCADLAEAAAVSVVLSLGLSAEVDVEPALAEVNAAPPPPEVVEAQNDASRALDSPPAVVQERRDPNPRAVDALPVRPAGVSKTAQRVRALVSLSALLDTGVVGGASPGARAALGAKFNDIVSVLGHGSVLASRSTSLAPAEGNAELDYAALGVLTCIGGLPLPLSLEACANGEFGWLSASAPELADAQAQTSGFPSVAVGLRANEEGGDAALNVEASVVFPLLRDRFTINQGQTVVHETPLWTLRAALGGTVSFF